MPWVYFTGEDWRCTSFSITTPKKYHTYFAFDLNKVVGLAMDSLKNIKIDAEQPETSSSLFYTFFLAKTWSLLYPQCQLVRDSGIIIKGFRCVVLVAANVASSSSPQAEMRSGLVSSLLSNSKPPDLF